MTGNRSAQDKLACAALAALLFACLLAGTDSLLRLEALPAAYLAGIAAAGLPVLSGRKKMPPAFCAAAVILCVLLFAGPLREGFLTLCAQLFSVSEAVNRYRYVALALTERGEALLPTVRVLLAVLGGSLCGAAAASEDRRICLVFTLFFAAFEGYFGITAASGFLQVLLLGAPLAVFAAKGREAIRPVNALFVLAVLLLAFGAAGQFAPGVSESLEARSEAMRDVLTPSEVQPEADTYALEAPKTHHESRFSETEGEAAQDAESFHREEKPRENISLPRRFASQPVLLILLEIAALFILPFLPFYFANRAAKKRQALLAVFEGEDRPAAICGMMDQIVRTLSAMGLSPGNRSNPDLAGDAGTLVSEAYARRFAACAQLQQEAAYSRHAMEEPSRQEVLELLRETEGLLAEKLNARQRLLAKYRDGLFTGA